MSEAKAKAKVSAINAEYRRAATVMRDRHNQESKRLAEKYAGTIRREAAALGYDQSVSAQRAIASQRARYWGLSFGRLKKK